jgi:hypothetical protein
VLECVGVEALIVAFIIYYLLFQTHFIHSLTTFISFHFIQKGDGNFIKANNTFLAFAATGGGGPVVIHPLNRIERFGPSPPVLNVHRAAVLDWDFSPFMENLIATGDDSGVVKITAFPEHGLTAHVEEASATLEGKYVQKMFLFYYFIFI